MTKLLWAAHCALILLLTAPAGALSVRETGAVGDGAADDTAAIQRALDAGQGIVELPAGRYRLTGTLILRPGGGLRGQGTLVMVEDEVVLGNEPPQSADRDSLEPGPSPGPYDEGIHIEGITIEKVHQPGSRSDCIWLERVDDLTIRGVDISGLASGAGIRLWECRGFLIEGCYIHDFLGDWVERNGEGLGISPRQSTDGRIVNNRIENIAVTDASALAHYYQTDGMEPHTCRNLTIMGNTIRNVGEGVDLVNCRSCVVSGNILDTCWHFGLKVIHGSRQVTLIGNTIRNTGLAGISLSYGNPEFGDGYANIVQGNTIANVGAIGIPRAAPGEQRGPEQGIWATWPHDAIDIAHDNREGNEIYDFLITDNTIWDDQTTPTCQYGILERYAVYDDAGDATVIDEPVWPGGLTRFVIRDNLISGMAVAPMLVYGMPE